MRRFVVAALIAPFLVLPVASSASAACSRTASDFNGDGYGDLAASAPYETVDGAPWAGSLHIAYGSSRGMTRFTSFTGHTDGLVRGFQGSDRLGESMASGYFDGDCYADLAVGAASGSKFLLLYGSPSGLGVARSAASDRTMIQPDGASGSGFGHELQAGDFNGDGFDDIASGAPWTDRNHGAFGVLYGSATGVTAAGGQWISQDSPGVPGAAEPGDVFGWELAAGDFNGDGRSDLAVAAWGEDLGSRDDAGGIVVFSGTAAGLTTTGATWWDQDSAGVSDTAEALDGFGDQLVAGDTTNDGRAELVVAAPTESVGRKGSAGMVHVFRGTPSGLVPGPGFNQDDPRIPGAAESSDTFGSALALADLNRDGRRDLAIGVRSETVGTTEFTGAVNILYSTATGLSATGAGYLDQNSPGVPGANERDDAFGSSLSRIPNAYGGDALVVGAPWEKLTYTFQGAVTVIPGAATGKPRPASYFFSAGNFPGGPAKDGNFGLGLP